MTTERKLDEILAEIGREHRAIGAPRSLEAALRSAAEARKDQVGARKVRVVWALAGAAMLLAAIAISGAIWQQHKNKPHDRQAHSAPARSGPAQQAGPDQPLSAAAVATHNGSAAASVRPRSAGAGHRPLRAALSERSTSNSLDEFVPLPVSEGLPPAAELSVVRITLLGSDLPQYGLEVPADAVARTMLAEFVVGEDGLPRAIRIVR